ncbi:ER membrane protein complex subunit 1 [Acrasis kona]|uniref:ER membrane protein complex subunit 1 n=1 Tax=Acrasis kona TaxID=1008807 RepID=A0AAW2Z1N9_9EUKA
MKYSLILFCTFVCVVNAIYQRDAGKNDWSKEFIGDIKHAAFGCDKKDLLVGSDNVIANINLRTGKITWRRVFESKEVIRRFEYATATCNLITLTNTLRVWDKNGLLIWDDNNVVDAALTEEGVVEVKKEFVRVRSITGKPIYNHTSSEEFTGILKGSPLTLSTKQSAVLVTSSGISKASSVNVEEGHKIVQGELVTATNQGYYAKLNPIDETKSRVVVHSNENKIEEFNINATQATLAFIRPYTSVDNKQQFNILVKHDDQLSLYNRSGLIWSRDEGLSQIKGLTFVELPTQTQAIQGNAIVSFEARLEKQLETLISLARSTVDGLVSLVKNGLKSDYVHRELNVGRDEFGFSKIMLITTSKSVYAVHTNGQVLWKKTFHSIFKTSDLSDVKLIVTNSPQQHDEKPVTPEFVLVAQRGNQALVATGNGLIGDITNLETIDFKLKDSFGVPVENGNNVLVLVSSDNQVIIRHGTHNTLTKQVYFYVHDKPTNSLQGYTIINSTPVPIWTVQFHHPIQSFAHHATKLNKHVYTNTIQHDETELSKYLNPNTFSVALEAPTSSSSDSNVEIYLIDSITGTTIYHTLYESSSGPINMLLEDNLLLITYMYNKPKRYQLSAIELYSNQIPSHAVNVKRTSFILPSAVRTISSTRTTLGITSKLYLLALTNGQVLSVNQKTIDTRRPRGVAPNPNQAEEGLLMYNPYIPLISQSLLTYNKTVHEVSRIDTSPSYLESTCHVVVSGLDMFYIRTAPSKQFDLLNDDFSFSLLVISTVALLVATFVVKWMAAKRELVRLWK